ncbi:MAG TPA: pseudouridine synthase [Burkholderiales bacterium]|nr:pseudouridine synthase [Burkholderiales bacterium]
MSAASQPHPTTHKLHKLLAQAGLGSRRSVERLIRSGQVTVNGRIAAVGTRVSVNDAVRVNKRVIELRFLPELARVIIYNKPEGEIVTRSDPQGRPSVFDRLPAIRFGRWISIGRLDYNTLGLLMFTNSGELANHMMHPKFEVEREYAVRIRGELSPGQMQQLRRGVELEDGQAKFERLEFTGGKGANRWYRVVVKEGRKRLVRRVFEALGFTVSRLIRLRFGEIRLPPRLKRGQLLELSQKEIAAILKSLA